MTADLLTRLDTHRRQREARGATQHERDLLEEVREALTRPRHGNSGPRYAPAESFKADVAAAFTEANSGRRQLAELHHLAREATRTDTTGSEMRAARDQLVSLCLSLGGEA